MLWELLVTPNPLVAWAAFLGTIVHLLNNKKKGRIEVLTVVASNYLAAVFLTDLLGEITGLKSLPGISFAIAMGGMFFVKKFIADLFKQAGKRNDSHGDPTDPTL